MFISNLWNNLNFLMHKDVVFYKFLKYVYSFPRLMPCHHSIDFVEGKKAFLHLLIKRIIYQASEQPGQ